MGVNKEWVYSRRLKAVVPEPVLSHVLGLMKDKRLRKVYLGIAQAPYSLYLAEGARYTFFYNGKRKSVRMQHSDSLHAGGAPMSYKVGDRVPPQYLPVGMWIVETELFLGKYFVTVFNISHNPDEFAAPLDGAQTPLLEDGDEH